MDQVIYGDILFLINFSMDFLALFITGKIMHRHMGTFALILASALGAFYALLNLFLNGNAYVGLAINIGVSLLMCYIVFGGTGVSEFLRTSLLFYAVNFALGGSMTALYNMVNNWRDSNKIYMNGSITTVYNDIPFEWFVVLAALSGILSFVFGRIFKKKTDEKIARVTAEFGGREIVLDCLSDSGNLLCDPISGRPVIITGFNELKPILPPELHYAFRRRNTAALGNIDIKFMKHVRIIPVSTIGHSGILIGFIPDKIMVDGVEKEACIAVADNGGLYNGRAAVIPSTLVN